MSGINVLPNHQMRRIRTVFKGTQLVSHDDSEKTRGMTPLEKQQYYVKTYIESQRSEGPRRTQ